MIVSLFCFAGFGQETVFPAKESVSYPTGGNAFLARFKGDIQSGKLPVVSKKYPQKTLQAYLEWGGKVHGLTAEEFKQELLGNVEIVELPASEVKNTAWYSSKAAYHFCNTKSKTVTILRNVDSGRILIKINCLNIVIGSAQYDILNDNVAFQGAAPAGAFVSQGDVIEGSVPGMTNGPTMVYQSTSQLLNFPQHFPTTSAVVGINPVPQMQLPVTYVNNTYSNGPVRNCTVQPNQPTTTWGGTPFTANTTGTGTSETTWNGNPFSGNNNGSSDNNTGGAFTGNGSIPGVNEYIRQAPVPTGRR